MKTRGDETTMMDAAKRLSASPQQGYVEGAITAREDVEER